MTTMNMKLVTSSMRHEDNDQLAMAITSVKHMVLPEYNEKQPTPMATINIRQAMFSEDNENNYQPAMATMNIKQVISSKCNGDNDQPVMATMVMQPWHMVSQRRDKLARFERY